MRESFMLLISLANQLDQEGHFEEADLIDEEFKKFLQALERGELTFDYTFSGGARDPRTPYSNPGRGPTWIFDV